MMSEEQRPDPVLKSGQQWCDSCDGCGWHEGGESIVTVCKDCKGTGIFPAPGYQVVSNRLVGSIPA